MENGTRASKTGFHLRRATPNSTWRIFASVRELNGRWHEYLVMDTSERERWKAVRILDRYMRSRLHVEENTVAVGMGGGSVLPRPRQKQGLLLDVALRRFLESREGMGCTKHTVGGYRWRLEIVCQWLKALGLTRLDQVVADTLLKYRAERLAARVHRRHKVEGQGVVRFELDRTVRRTTVNHEMRCIRAWLRYFEEELPQSPTRDRKFRFVIPAEKLTPDVLSRDQAARLLQLLQDEVSDQEARGLTRTNRPLLTFVMIGLNAGLRRHEIIATKTASGPQGGLM